MDGTQGTASYVHKILARAQGELRPSSLIPPAGWQGRRAQGITPDPFEAAVESDPASDAGSANAFGFEANAPRPPAAQQAVQTAPAPATAERPAQVFEVPVDPGHPAQTRVRLFRKPEPAGKESTGESIPTGKHFKEASSPGYPGEIHSTPAAMHPDEPANERIAMQAAPAPELLNVNAPEAPQRAPEPAPFRRATLEPRMDPEQTGPGATPGPRFLSRERDRTSGAELSPAANQGTKAGGKITAAPARQPLLPKPQPLRHTAPLASASRDRDAGAQLVIQRLRVEVLPAPAAPPNGAQGKFTARPPRTAAPGPKPSPASPLRFGLGQL